MVLSILPKSSCLAGSNLLYETCASPTTTSSLPAAKPSYASLMNCSRGMPSCLPFLRSGWCFSSWSSADVALLVSDRKIGGSEGHTLHSRWIELYDLDCGSSQLLTQAKDVLMHGRFACAVICASDDWHQGKARCRASYGLVALPAGPINDFTY